jgi:formate hydrogenlyase subunit 4
VIMAAVDHHLCPALMAAVYHQHRHHLAQMAAVYHQHPHHLAQMAVVCHQFLLAEVAAIAKTAMNFVAFGRHLESVTRTDFG